MSSLLDQRRHDWQASFRSMFQVWTAKLRDLEKQGAAAGEGGGLPPTQEELSRCSFYSILPQQVVLFRGGAAEGAGEEGERRLAPMIVFSSTTPQLRAKINSMGVDLRLFTQQQHEGAVRGGGSGGHDVFSEHLLNAEDVPPGGEAGTDTRAEEGNAASVHAGSHQMDRQRTGESDHRLEEKETSEIRSEEQRQLPPAVRGRRR